ncbi:carbohydrate esterase family 9 protein [Heterobasidion irregulare TC 32-1]|uniref:N-acetylglucosamine-6-phosphate deacetylase n=1 Tax=Heterobasidion irregulare (strain TC 32-1) TaxID=747525 RepID=W4JN11_HETIT|nr:carbohydrate esterase family 9 protein [Heterobasidion irregulare TC 32-1]ETW74854.1 carbohydrate esterase family 9 protein [Heterobasidion irregulare TC 32-1]
MTSPNGLICFTNCLIPLEDGSLVKKDLWIDERRGVVLDSQHTFYHRKERPQRMIDLGGNIISPGFLDIQINGAYGFDFSVYEGDDEAYRRGMRTVSENIVETGVTSLVPTVITQERSLYPILLNLLRPFHSSNGATLLGWHAEGPFLHMAKRGAHAPPFLLTAPKGVSTFEDVYGVPNISHTEDWLMDGGVGVRIITGAPEIEGVMDAIKDLTARGIVFSIGHSIATTDIATAAVRRGARLITHLFNAMPQLHHRDPSIIGLLDMTFERPFYEMIVDGIHSHPNSVRLAYNVFPEGCILITDAMKILDPHLRDGVHEWRDGKRFVKEGDRLYLEGTDTLAGRQAQVIVSRSFITAAYPHVRSVVTLDKCVRNFARFTGCSLGEALKCVTLNPARCLGIENKKGTLRPGADADLVVLDRMGNVLSTWVGGREVWARSSD